MSDREAKLALIWLTGGMAASSERVQGEPHKALYTMRDGIQWLAKSDSVLDH
jgi:hypothetical protein